MEIKLPFRSPSRTTWRLVASGAAFGIFAYWLSARAVGPGEEATFGFGSFAVLALALFALALPFSEWRKVRYSLFALILTLGAFFMGEFAMFSPAVKALVAGACAGALFTAMTPQRDSRRMAIRVFIVALTFLAATLLFIDPSPLMFVGFAVVVALLMRDEARAWGALRVGEGKLIGAAVGLLAAELTAFIGVLPLGPVRSAALTTLILLLIGEGLGEAHRGTLGKPLIFQGLAAFFILSVLLFASVSWAV